MSLLLCSEKKPNGESFPPKIQKKRKLSGQFMAFLCLLLPVCSPQTMKNSRTKLWKDFDKAFEIITVVAWNFVSFLHIWKPKAQAVDWKSSNKSSRKAFKVYSALTKTFNEIYRKLQTQLKLRVVCVLVCSSKPLPNAKLINSLVITETRRKTCNWRHSVLVQD